MTITKKNTQPLAHELAHRPTHSPSRNSRKHTDYSTYTKEIHRYHQSAGGTRRAQTVAQTYNTLNRSACQAASTQAEPLCSGTQQPHRQSAWCCAAEPVSGELGWGLTT